MKKALVGFLAVALVAGMSTLVFADGKGLGIKGSPHDFTDNFKTSSTGPVDVDEVSGTGWNKRGEICRVCHVPHDHSVATKNYENGLLWNHGVSVATYTMYSSSTLNGSASTSPDGTSKLCLACHDGTVALDTFDKYANTTTFIVNYDAGYKVPGFDVSGTKDLRGTHPISIVYNDTLDTKLNAKTVGMGSSGTISDVLDQGKVQCSSCHDVHDQESVDGTHLLRVAQKGANPSGLCLTCHIK